MTNINKDIKEQWGAQIQHFAVSSELNIHEYVKSKEQVIQKVPTGMKELDKMLGGGFSQGLTALGGVPNAGKTTLICNVMFSMSRIKQRSVFLTYDMRWYELVDKFYSMVSFELYGEEGYTLGDLAKKAMLEDNEKNRKIFKTVVDDGAYMQVVDMLSDSSFRDFLGQQEGFSTMQDYEKVFSVYSMAYENTVFFIDNLQQMAGFMGYEGKAGIDKMLRELKACSSKYNIPIVIISTIGRASYNKDLDLSAFKESGNIDFDISTALVLQGKFIQDGEDISVDEFREQKKRDITVKSVKSRDTGYAKCHLTLNAPYCTFEPYSGPVDGDRVTSVKKNSKKQRKSKEKGDKVAVPIVARGKGEFVS